MVVTGIWNASAGPDFLHAHIRMGNREFRGDVEVHLEQEGWKQHGHDGDPRKTGSLLFNLQFDGRPEEYPTLFRDCKLCTPVRSYIRNIVADDPQSGFARLLPQLGEELPQRIRRANQLLSDQD